MRCLPKFHATPRRARARPRIPTVRHRPVGKLELVQPMGSSLEQCRLRFHQFDRTGSSASLDFTLCPGGFTLVDTLASHRSVASATIRWFVALSAELQHCAGFFGHGERDVFSTGASCDLSAWRKTNISTRGLDTRPIVQVPLARLATCDNDRPALGPRQEDLFTAGIELWEAS